ncbi:DUF4132 domain-containing protein [Pelotomaculum propionicicum]|uniref:DUF4132 domain-containing protein n=1 Tax=Pelotomaculum propionicicum TaxID=258475 RepID=UPI003B82A499
MLIGLYNTLWTGDKIAGVFSGSEYKVLVRLIGEEWAGKFKKIWDRSTNYTYSTGLARRSYRAKTNEALYLASGVSKLLDMVYLAANDFTYNKYFSRENNTFQNIPVISDLLALEMDEGNEAVINKVRDIVYGDNNTGLVSREIIKGLLMSRSGEAHKWAGDLLLAARLQEGLRQVIVECVDEGSKEGFLHILKIILDHDLVRFSSVVRALDVWTGLGISAQKPAVVQKCLETGYRCLTESGYACACLESSDAMLIFMGLWAMAYEDIAMTEDKIKTLLSANDKYKRMAALYFLAQTQFPTYQHSLAVQLLDDPDLEVKSWALVNLFADTNYITLRPEFQDELEKYNKIKGVCSRQELLEKLKKMLDSMPKKEVTFRESIFPWLQLTVSCDEIILKMLLAMAGKAADSDVELLLDYRDKMNVDTRREFVNAFLYDPRTRKQKTAIVELLGDKSPYVRSTVLGIVEKLKLSPDDYRIIEDLLQYKAGDLRKNAISILLLQPPEALLGSVKRLLEAGDENKHLAALDIISSVENKPKYAGISHECRRIAAVLAETSQKTRILSEKIINKEAAHFSAADGFGLFSPGQEIPLIRLSCPKGFSARDVLSSSYDQIKKTMLVFSRLFDKHKDYEYEAEDWNGTYQKVILGAENHLRTTKKSAWGDLSITIDYFPLPEVWRGAAKEHNLEAKQLLEILFYYNFFQWYYMKTQGWYDALLADLFPVNHKEFSVMVKKLPYSYHIARIFRALLNEWPKPEVFSLCRNMSCFIFNKVPAKRFTEGIVKRDQPGHYFGGHNYILVNAKEILFWLDGMRENIYDDQSFKEYFQTGYAFYRASEYKSHASLRLEDFEKAFDMGLADENELYAELCGRPLSAENLRSLTDTDYHSKNLSSCRKLNEVCGIVVDRVVGIELKRGDMTTEVSHLASRIFKCSGARFFVDILVGAEKDTYVRGYNFVGDNTTKKQIFSHLLKHCLPADGEDENTLGELLKNKKVTEKQLVDAAMYAPRWLDLVEKYLNWPGLKSAGWYFHAHLNQNFSDDRETLVARYSPVSPQDLKDGAFDIEWFNEACSELGEKRFKTVYDSAKYIAGGGLHKRSQLFADAVRGKIDIEQAEKKINEKRNKDYVLCYGLIPLGGDKRDMLHRYEFLHGFLKESKQFGAQRRESEAKAVSIALENLARNAGFSDVTRFTWNMETEKIRSIERYLKPVSVEDIDIHIGIDELGRTSVIVTKGGKALRDIPSRLKKNDYVREIKAVQKSLKDQYSRARATLEKAMESGDVFTAGELDSLSQNLVIYPLLQNLVFKSGSRLGYFKNNVLVGAGDQKFDMGPEDKCVIAHPVHLYESGEWAAYQRDIYDKKIVQPFKQVFRELYRPNADELAARTISRRYDGHQIQPKKAAALLKGRGWTASYGEGLQKVYYKENIIAQIYAMADWFSPADVEAPTLEGVVFIDRKTDKLVPFTDVPEVIFSEIMRDVDLVVSVAHVGGVDPEASLSTVEMRAAIITEMLRLLKLANVELKGSHAFIGGTLGEYTVHLGSGVAHKMASGALHILPVHSQHRGRIFLPFVDDDPKTAEIISKIVFLAEDSKIKDPTILDQIKA